MNPILILMSSVVLTLGASAATPPATAPVETLANLASAWQGESNATLRYELFAAKAEREGEKHADRLFRAASKAKEIHELRPGRLADYALIDRAAALPGWSVLAVAAVLAGGYRFRGSEFVRRLSRRMAMMFGSADQWKIVAGGVALPFLLMLALIHFTPLGSRGWSLSTQGGIIVAGQLLALLLLLLHLPPLFARRLLARRAGRVGLAAPAPPTGWLAVLAAAAALPVFGLAQWASLPEPLMERFVQGSSLFEFDPGEANGAGKSWLWTGVGFLGVSVICGVVAVLRLLFSSRKELPRRLVLSRLVFPAYLAGTLVFAISMPVYHAIERHWFAKDSIMKFADEDWGLTPVEARLTALESAQIRDAIESTR